MKENKDWRQGADKMKVLDIIINDVLTTDLIYVNIDIFTPIYILLISQTMC